MSRKLPMYQRARLGIGYLPQEASIFRGLTVEDNIRSVLEVVEPDKKRRARDLDALLEEFNIARLRKTPAIALSGGERRRCEIARALATRPNYMLLDEPFAGIDPIAVGDIQSLVRHLTNRGIGVLITDHNVRETLGLTDRAYIIYSGEVLMEGRADEIVNNPDVRRLYLGEEFRLSADPSKDHAQSSSVKVSPGRRAVRRRSDRAPTPTHLSPVRISSMTKSGRRLDSR